MKRKTALALIIALSVLMFYGGCGDDSDGDSAPPGSGPPPGSPCENCPCNFYAIPQTQACWENPVFMFVNLPAGTDCALSSQTTNVDPLSVVGPPGDPICLARLDVHRIKPECFPPCGSNTCIFDRHDLNPDQLSACQQCLVQYASELNMVVPVVGDPIACPPPP
jgi:hypothetical protein